MARYIITSGSKFEPYSYDELVKPLAQATEAHKETQAAYDELATNAGSIGQLIGDGEGSKEARAMYDNYMNSINGYIDELSENGYGINAQRGLSQMRKMYGTQITGIANAIERRRKISDTLWEMGQKDPSLLIEFDPQNMGLDNWLKNPEYTGPKTMSGAYLEKLASDAAENFKNVLTSEANTRKWNPILGGQYFEAATFNGATPQQIEDAKQAFINNTVSDDIVVNGLADIMRNVYASSGVDAWGNPEAKAKAASYIGNGINSALGKTTFETLANKGWGVSGTSSSKKKGDGGTSPYRNFERGYGREDYLGGSRKEVLKLENDIKDIERLKQMAIAGEGFKFTEDEIKDRDARAKALEAKRKWVNNGQPKLDSTYEGDRAIAKAYYDAIAAFPEYEKLPYNYSGSYANGYAQNDEFNAELLRVTSNPEDLYNRLLKEYGNGNEKANLDDLYAEATRQSRERGRRTNPALFYDTESADIQRGISSYLDRKDNKTISSLVVDELTGEHIKPAEANRVRLALGNSRARVGIDDYTGTPFIIGHDEKGNQFYYSFNTSMYDDVIYNGYTRDYAQRIVDNLNIPQEVKNDFARTFDANENGGTVGAQTAISRVAEWNQRYVGTDYEYLANLILDEVMGEIHSHASNRRRGDEGNNEEHGY